MNVDDPLITIDQATAHLGLEATPRVHWALGQMIARIWEARGREAHYEIRPKTDPNASVPAGHFKRVYPMTFVLFEVRRLHDTAQRQLDLFD